MKEYLRGGDDRQIDREHAADFERHRRQLHHGDPQAVPGEEVLDQIPDDEATPEAFDTVDEHRRRWSSGFRRRQREREPRAAYASGQCDELYWRGNMAYSEQSHAIRRHSGIKAAAVQGRAVHPLAAGRATSKSSSRAGARCRRCINLCANNYLGLSSHPEVVAAAHAGAGRARLRHVVACASSAARRTCTASSSSKLTEFLGTEDTILFPSCMDANAGVFEAMLDRAGRDDRRPPGARQHRRRHAPVQGDARHLQALRHGAPGGEAAGAPGQALPRDHHRRRLLAWTATSRRSTRSVALAEKYDAMVFVDDCHATGFIGKTGRGTHEHCGVLGQDRHHHHDAGQGAGRRVRRLRSRAARRSSSCAGSGRGRTCSATPWRRSIVGGRAQGAGLI